jgi:malto-oligosyltrehalose synthase/4-alpha-glucanotransferase
MVYNPINTYRIQFSRHFNLSQFNQVLPYLHNLGIKTIYASPIFGAVPGSTYGYDVTNPNVINPEIGTLEQLRETIVRMETMGMGWIQDIVPNHMAFSVHNPWIFDVLEKGRDSGYSRFFDIEWDHPDENLKGKLMLPFLGKPLHELVAAKEILIHWSGQRFVLKYYENEFPLNYASYLVILDKSKKDLLPNALLEPLGYFEKSLKHLEEGEKGLAELDMLYQQDSQIRDYIRVNLEAINADNELLKELIHLQHYLPVHWKMSEKKLNYRRFFTINGMICLRMQDPYVFDAFHTLIGTLCKEGLFKGLRVDHIDGLYDPQEYLNRLRERIGENQYIVVEKILEKNENIEQNWPIQGETGYSFLGLVNNLLTNEKNRHVMEKAYQYWGNTGELKFREVIHQKKRFILYYRMAGDLDNLYNYMVQLDLVEPKIYDVEKLKDAIGEFLINCPVYKFYGSPANFTGDQKIEIDHVIARAIQQAPHLADELILLKTLFLQGKNLFGKKLKNIEAFFRRCMQYAGPLMAKGAEDTAYYTYNRFVVHNEVGDSPSYFGITANDFHEEMAKRQLLFPLTMNTTSTHDTKRGEDARARLTVLSDLPHLWSEHIQKWRVVNRKHKAIDEKGETPSLNDEYFIYQTIAGFIPADGQTGADFMQRLKAYATKALREGKTETDWRDPDQEYEKRTHQFVEEILKDGSEFKIDLVHFLKKAAFLGVVNSISQQLLKFTCPGIPDIYQGSESWNFSFVDPDNRRPVDYASLHSMLNSLQSNGQPLSSLWQSPFDPAIKLALVHLLLKQRTANPDVFAKGEYIPMQIKGNSAGLAFAYARRYKSTLYITAFSIHGGSLADHDRPWGMVQKAWEGTYIELPDFWPNTYENLLTKKNINSGKSLYLRELFDEIPFALLKADMETTERQAGLLMHLTSLPGPYGIGDMGPEAYGFADFLKRNGQKYWQVLPLNQVYQKGGYSPYSSLSAFAGNVFLLSPEWLVAQKLLDRLPEAISRTHADQVDFKHAETLKENLIDAVFEYFFSKPPEVLNHEYHLYKEKESFWLNDYALFMTLKKELGTASWNEWPIEFKNREAGPLQKFEEDHIKSIEREKFAQFLFMQQWRALKTYCNDRDIKIFGDIPIYINYESADVWSHPEWFKLKDNKEKDLVAGVPPDYFSKTGQLWGMPVFRWDVMEWDGFSWWKNRLKKNLELFDLLRLDHFRAFSAYWEVPAEEKTAVNGRWVKAPGEKLFYELQKEFPHMPFVAEDLGEVDQDVYNLRDKFGMPGMNVLQFSFGSDTGKSIHSMHNHIPNSIVYTGTHDNNTTKGWYNNETSKSQRQNLDDYMGKRIISNNSHWELIRLAYASVSRLAIVPIQDVLGLGSNARMNIPSTEEGNWAWRMRKDALTPKMEAILRQFVQLYGRF